MNAYSFGKRCVQYGRENSCTPKTGLPSQMTAGFFVVPNPRRRSLQKALRIDVDLELEIALVLGPAASHSRKYSDRSTDRSAFTSSRKR